MLVGAMRARGMHPRRFHEGVLVTSLGARRVISCMNVSIHRKGGELVGVAAMRALEQQLVQSLIKS